MCIGGNIDNISHTGEVLGQYSNIEFNVAWGINNFSRAQVRS